MGRERTPLKREYKGEVTINVAEIWRSPEMQDEAIKGCKKIKGCKRKSDGEKRCKMDTQHNNKRY